jgi:hypothetical protein
MIKLRLVASLIIASLLLGLAPFSTNNVDAIGASDFKPGRIIDDSIFFNGNSMTAGEIQDFLNSKIPACDTNHAPGGGYNPPFTCLKDYQQIISGRTADQYCTGTVGAGTKSAAQIIKEVSVACSVNPKVILVLLQKEQSLITDTWPWSIQYERATGFACPDTAPCDPEYAGFFNQVWYGARQYQRYAKQSSSFGYKFGRSNYIQYNPNTSCGGTNVFIQNQATAGLYNYTPYQPNAAALNNLRGTGDSCSAYGNRNFWRLFNDWFGPTTTDSNTDVLTFIRLNHGSGKVESLGLPSIGSYAYISRNNLTGYPAVAPDGAVVPIFWTPNGDLVFIRLNHGSGKVELLSYSSGSGFQQLVNYSLTGYPAVAPDGAVVPLFWPPNGDLSFIRLNHGSGNVEVITYGVGSNFKQIVNSTLTGYPAVAPDGAVVPLYKPNGDLSFIRLNHSSGKVEVITYSAASNFKQAIDYRLVEYPAVAPDGAVVPLFTR